MAGQGLRKPSLESPRNDLKEQHFQVFLSIASKVKGGAKERMVVTDSDRSSRGHPLGLVG